LASQERQRKNQQNDPFGGAKPLACYKLILVTGCSMLDRKITERRQKIGVRIQNAKKNH